MSKLQFNYPVNKTDTIYEYTSDSGKHALHLNRYAIYHLDVIINEALNKEAILGSKDKLKQMLLNSTLAYTTPKISDVHYYIAVDDGNTVLDESSLEDGVEYHVAGLYLGMAVTRESIENTIDGVLRYRDDKSENDHVLIAIENNDVGSYVTKSYWTKDNSSLIEYDTNHVYDKDINEIVEEWNKEVQDIATKSNRVILKSAAILEVWSNEYKSRAIISLDLYNKLKDSSDLSAVKVYYNAIIVDID